jgi:hypothetical protein
MKRTTHVLGLAFVLVFLATATFAQNSTRGDAVQIQPATYRVNVTSNVRGATIYVDNVRQWTRTPATLRLTRGSYLFRIEARGYQVWQERITVSGNTSIYAELQPPVAIIMFEIPNELLNYDVRNPWRLIEIYVNDMLRYEQRIEVEAGWTEIAIVSGGLRLESEVYLEAGKTYTAEMLLRLAVDEITVPGRR